MKTLTMEEAVLGDLDDELAATRLLIERLPDNAWDWSPGEPCWPLGNLANHTVQLVFWIRTTLDRDEFDAGQESDAGEEGRVVAGDSAALLARFDELAAQVREAAQRVSARDLGQPWTLRVGEHVVFTLPRAVALRRMCVSHLVHHRAQLGLYARLRGVEPPPLYGPPAGTS